MKTAFNDLLIAIVLFSGGHPLLPAFADMRDIRAVSFPSDLRAYVPF